MAISIHFSRAYQAAVGSSEALGSHRKLLSRGKHYIPSIQTEQFPPLNHFAPDDLFQSIQLKNVPNPSTRILEEESEVMDLA
jgi:hypothetical protein